MTARTYLGGKWSGLTEAAFVVASPLAITEIMYNPPAPTAAEIAAGFTDKELFEYIEITNTGVGTVSLANVRLVDGITFNFAAGSVATLAPGEFVVVVRNQAAFAARYGTGINVAGAFTGALSNSGERIALEHGVGVTVEAVEYGDSGDWPGRADGNGSSLERIDMAVDVADPANWRSSTEYGGSPGREGLAPVIDVVVNEVLANPGTGALDAIELLQHDRAGDRRRRLVPERFERQLPQVRDSGGHDPAGRRLPGVRRERFQRLGRSGPERFRPERLARRRRVAVGDGRRGQADAVCGPRRVRRDGRGRVLRPLARRRRALPDERTDARRGERRGADRPGDR